MILAGLILALGATSSAQMPASDADGYRPKPDAYNFTLALPPEATLMHREILDFDLYRVEIGGRTVLNLYEGWTADVSGWVTDRHAPQRQQRLLNGAPVEYFWNKTCDGWSNEVHAWITAEVAPQDAVEARRIADTVSMKPCTNDPQPQ
jgi:hypothetical protein